MIIASQRLGSKKLSLFELYGAAIKSKFIGILFEKLPNTDQSWVLTFCNSFRNESHKIKNL